MSSVDGVGVEEISGNSLTGGYPSVLRSDETSSSPAMNPRARAKLLRAVTRMTPTLVVSAGCGAGISGSGAPGDVVPDAGASSVAPDASPARVCGPSGGGPYWIEEGETVTATIACAKGIKISGDAFTLIGLPGAARYDPGTATLTWQTGLADANVYRIEIVASRFDERGAITIGVADRFDDPKNVPIANPATYTEEFGLPVFHLTTPPELGPSYLPKLEAWKAQMQDTCTSPCYQDPYFPFGVVYRGHAYASAAGHYHGSKSVSYPKRSYTLKFDDADELKESVLGGGRIRKQDHIVLLTTFDDNSYVRYRLALELWNRLDPSTMQIAHYSAVVYVNGAYQGLYTVADQLNDAGFMKRNGLSPQGNFYNGLTHDASFAPMPGDTGLPMPRKCPFQGFGKKNGLPAACDGTTFVPAAFDDLVPLVNFVASASTAAFHARVAQMIVPADYIRWFIQATAVKAGDSYEKNAYHYHEPGGGPWRLVLWDYNDSFGQTYNTGRRPANDDPAGAPVHPWGTDDTKWTTGTNYLWTRLWQDPTYGPQMKARYAGALAKELKLPDVLAAFDALVTETSASAQRDQRLWGQAYKDSYGPASELMRMDLTTYAEEVAYTRKWIMERWQHLKTLYR